MRHTSKLKYISRKGTIALFALLLSCFASAYAQNKGVDDRAYWTDLLYRISEPVLRNMSSGKLVKNMELELSPAWDGRNTRVAYMETFARLMSGLSPWLTLPDDNTPEGVRRKQLRDWALKSYANAVDPKSPDCLLWDKEAQVLVDAAFLANSFLRAPDQLWKPLDDITKKRYVERFQSLRRVDPPYNNWLLFSAMVETFLMSVGEQYDAFRIHTAIRKTEEWYVGDGWYADGEHFAFDYYNAFVIQPMYVEILEELVRQKKMVKPDDLALAEKRMQRYDVILERLISPEGAFPAFGRSITYRMGVFQPLALSAWRGKLPDELPEGQVRSALTCVMKRMFSVDGNFGKDGFLQLGFAGHQPGISDGYTNNGSLYLTSFVFLPLGLPADHSFWTSDAQDWTAKKAWSGQPFPKDKAVRY